MQHFLLSSGQWQGSGTISFSMSPDILHFRMLWQITQTSDSTWKALQTVEVLESHTMTNSFKIMAKESGRFDLLYENETVGTFTGSGICEKETISWSYEHPGEFQGVERYQRKGEFSYQFRSEYDGGDGFKTIIEGSLNQ